MSNPTPDAGHDSGKDTGAEKDTGAKKDVETEKDSAADVEKNDAGDHDGGEKDGASDKDGATEGGTHEDGSASDAAHDGPVDGARDGATDAHDAATAATVQNYFMGRWDLTSLVAATGVGAVAEWPGSGVITTFTGANITAYLSDACTVACDTISIEIDGAPPTVAETVTIDNVAKTGNVFALTSGANTITVSGLTTGVNHTIGIYKNTDSINGGSLTVSQAFQTAAGGSNPKASYNFSHRIEFIGDDVTDGTGVLPCTGQTDDTNSIEYDSYARIVAEYFNADRHNISGANVGVYESDPPTASGGPPLIGTLFPLVLPSEATSAWFPASATNVSNPLPGYVPDLVVVNIGNYGDFSNDDPPTSTLTATQYETALETLLTNVRAQYPSTTNTAILVALGPGYAGSEDGITVYNTWAQAAVTNRKAAANGETATSIAFYAITSYSGYQYTGCQDRPTVDDQQRYAAAIESTIKTSFGWTPETWAP